MRRFYSEMQEVLKALKYFDSNDISASISRISRKTHLPHSRIREIFKALKNDLPGYITLKWDKHKGANSVIRIDKGRPDWLHFINSLIKEGFNEQSELVVPEIELILTELLEELPSGNGFVIDHIIGKIEWQNEEIRNLYSINNSNWHFDITKYLASNDFVEYIEEGNMSYIRLNERGKKLKLYKSISRFNEYEQRLLKTEGRKNWKERNWLFLACLGFVTGVISGLIVEGMLQVIPLKNHTQTKQEIPYSKLQPVHS